MAQLLGSPDLRRREFRRKAAERLVQVRSNLVEALADPSSGGTPLIR